MSLKLSRENKTLHTGNNDMFTGFSSEKKQNHRAIKMFYRSEGEIKPFSGKGKLR